MIQEPMVLFCCPDDDLGIEQARSYVKENKYTSDFVRIQRITEGGNDLVRVLCKNTMPVPFGVQFMWACRRIGSDRYRWSNIKWALQKRTY